MTNTSETNALNLMGHRNFFSFHDDDDVEFMLFLRMIVNSDVTPRINRTKFGFFFFLPKKGVFILSLYLYVSPTRDNFEQRITSMSGRETRERIDQKAEAVVNIHSLSLHAIVLIPQSAFYLSPDFVEKPTLL